MLSQHYPNRVLMKSSNGFSVNWSTMFDHVAMYGADGSLKLSYYPATAGLTFHRIADAAIQPDGGLVLAGTLAETANALVFVSHQGITASVVRTHPGYAGRIARSNDGKLWTVGRSPRMGDLNVVSVFSGQGQLEFTTLDPKDLPVPIARMQWGATFLAPWRQSVLWVLPEHEVAIVFSAKGEVLRRIRIARHEDDVTGAWTIGDTLLLALSRTEKTAAVLEVDLMTGATRLRSLPEGGHPIGVFGERLVRYSKNMGTLAFEPRAW